MCIRDSPKGTVTVTDLTNQNVSHLDFTVFDSEAKRAELVQNGVILKKGTAPSEMCIRDSIRTACRCVQHYRGKISADKSFP